MDTSPGDKKAVLDTKQISVGHFPLFLIRVRSEILSISENNNGL